MSKAFVRKFIIAIFLIVAGVGAFACEMIFTLDAEKSVSMNVIPGSEVKLVKWQSYKLTVEFNEDHRNCKIPASETIFLLNGEKWRVNKETQSLILKNSIEWKEETKTKNIVVIEFVASVAGEQKLQIVRECSKGGYNETITFVVE